MELLAVIVVLAIILVIATQQINKTIKTARTNSYISSIKVIRKEIERICTMGEELTEGAIKDAVDFPGIRIGICQDATNVHISGYGDTEFGKDDLDLDLLQSELENSIYTVNTGDDYKVEFNSSCAAKYFINTSTAKTDNDEVMDYCSNWGEREIR